MALQLVDQAEEASLSLDVVGGIVVGVSISVPGPHSAVLTVTNPAGQDVRSGTFAPQAAPYVFNVPNNRRAVYDDGNPTGTAAWGHTFGTA